MGIREEVIQLVTELAPSFGANSLLVFTMGLKLGDSDHAQLLRDNVLDGPQDKKIDFLHVTAQVGCGLVEIRCGGD